MSSTLLPLNEAKHSFVGVVASASTVISTCAPHVVLSDDETTETSGAERLTVRSNKGLEPAARQGGPPDNERARRPPFFSLKRRHRKSAP
jgi:hypothetical protein